MKVSRLRLGVFRICGNDQLKYGLAAFMIPLLVRAVPEVLAGPYPIGLDTLRYVRAIVGGWALRLDPMAVLKSTNLFYIMATAIHGFFGVDAVLLVKILGPFMDGVLGFLIFAYARYVLRWGYRKSLVSSALASVYFISLIISVYYRQVLGLIFFMASLVSLNGFKSPYRYVATIVFVVLAVLSHELVAVLMLFVFGVEALSHLWKRALRDFTYLTAITGVAASLFLFQRYSPSVGTISIPSGSTVYESSTSAASQVLGFIGYSYVLILPLAILGFRALKNKALLCWFVLCLGASITPMLNVQATVVEWWRWAYLLVYPLAFCATEGVANLLNIKTGKNLYRQAAKAILLIFMLSLILVPSTFYLSTYPEEPFPYFGQYNPYLMYVPSSMLQNALSIKDNPSVVRCFEWLNENMGNDSMLVTHEAMNDFAALYLQGGKSVRQLYKSEISRAAEEALADEMVKAAEKAVADGWSKVYTVWWVNGKGWYGMPQLPRQFAEIQRFGNMGVFQYVQ